MKLRHLSLAALAGALLLAADAAAQRGAQPAAPAPTQVAPNVYPGPIQGNARQQQLGLGQRPAIMLTGYWPPTNEAVRRFSDDPVQNPLGWIGSDWEGRGYDVYAYFPEFTPPTCTSCGTGSGDLEVDYQDTSADFWPLADAIKPIAIITFSRTNATLSWEVEMNQYNRSTWINDYVAPLQPTPAPPDASVPAGTLRLSALPVQEIIDNVLDANLGLNAFICFSGSAGGFLSEFIAYHGVWYQAIHASPSDPAWCVAAGHVHVGSGVPWGKAQDAVEVTLRTVIHYVDTIVDPTVLPVDLYCPTTTNSAGTGAMLTTAGSTSISANSLRFLVTDTPPSAAGLLLYSAGQASVPWGNGTRCIANPFVRVNPVGASNAQGFVDRAVDLSSSPLGAGTAAVTAGSTWYFQYAFRDVAGGGALFDSTNGAAVTFGP
ncbi:MAG: hypothetical protein H6828_06980 [Planctomycetes bacterium]|nr:hypothetical protein [Planctomycetota bacterium]